MSISYDLGRVVGRDGTQGAAGPQGPQGAAGPQGPAGADGVSPVITGSKAGKVTTLTIVDADHPSPGAVLATINDGADGQGSGDMRKDTYDTDDDGVVDNAAALGGHAASWFAAAADIPTAVSELTNDAGYLTAHQDISGKQDKITASGVLKGNGNGGVSAAVAGTDYVSPTNLTNRVNRSTNVNAADTNYTTLMARGESLNASETTPAVNGAIAWTYE